MTYSGQWKWQKWYCGGPWGTWQLLPLPSWYAEISTGQGGWSNLEKEKKKAIWRNTSVPSEQPMPAARHVSDTNLDLSACLPLRLNAATWMSPGKTRRGTLQPTHRIMRKNKSLSSSMTGFGVVYHTAIGNWNRCFYINCSQSLFEGCSEGHEDPGFSGLPCSRLKYTPVIREKSQAESQTFSGRSCQQMQEHWALGWCESCFYYHLKISFSPYI